MKVVTVQSDPGGSGVGNVYRLGWKEECVDDADDACEVRAKSEEDKHETAERIKSNTLPTAQRCYFCCRN